MVEAVVIERHLVISLICYFSVIYGVQPPTSMDSLLRRGMMNSRLLGICCGLGRAHTHRPPVLRVIGDTVLPRGH